MQLTIKKQEKTITDFAIEIDDILDSCLRETSNQTNKQIISIFNIIEKEITSQSNLILTTEEILKIALESQSQELNKLLDLLAQNFPLQLSSHKIKWFKSKTQVGEIASYNHVFEDDRIPHYYILHLDFIQNYQLLHKKKGIILPLYWHDVCPSNNESIVHGRVNQGMYENFDFCSLHFDYTKPVTDYSAQLIENKNLSVYDEIIFPKKTNVEHFYIPCQKNVDQLLLEKIIEKTDKYRFGNNNYSTGDNTDDLPF
jgi:hypothetical protein